MFRRVVWGSLVMLLAQFDLASSQMGVVVLESPNIRAIPRETLGDLAVAFATPGDPVIYYNPRLMARFGPEITAFVFAHESGHILYEHRRPGPNANLSRDALEQLLQSWELQADCAAAIWLARERPAALQAAITYFDRMGTSRVDREHPTGSARAAQLEACGRSANGDPRFGSEGPRLTMAISFK